MNLNQHPETLLVCRDGYIDDDYYNAVYAWKRKEALKTMGREVVHLAAQAPAFLGKGLLNALIIVAEQAN